MPPELITLGCRLNTLESEAIRAAVAGADNLVVVNSCAVTAEAVRQARQTIRKVRRERPTARIVVTGCAAQTEAHTFLAMPEVDALVANDRKTHPQSWSEHILAARGDAGIARANPDSAFGDPPTPFLAASSLASPAALPLQPDSFEGRARAFVAVQNGCDHSCTFCIIPQGRGHSRSVPMPQVSAQVQRLIDNGYPEIVLTGVDLTSYGTDFGEGNTLGTLVAYLLDTVPGLQRLRLSSLDSIEIDPLLMRLLCEEPRLLPHVHLSLQAGDDLILKRMKRRHLRADAIDFCAELRAKRPDFAFGADLIAGFPTETEAQFAQSCALITECGLNFVHVFPFSPRPQTPAARMPQLAPAVIKARAARLREAGMQALSAHLDQHTRRYGAKPARILTERGGRGRLDDFTPVDLGQAFAPGEIVFLPIVGHDGARLQAAQAAPTAMGEK